MEIFLRSGKFTAPRDKELYRTRARWHNTAMTSHTSDIPDQLRTPLLEAALSHVPFDGWSDKILTIAAQDLNLDPGIARLAFPGGIRDMIDLLATQQDQKMIAICTEDALSGLKIRQKITLLVRSRIEAELDIRDAALSAVTWLALPQNSVLGLKILYRTVGHMWKCTNDLSTDLNYYTKRMTLSAVYSATFLYWLNDESDDYSESWDFLDRRINNVMQFEKSKSKLLKLWAKAPDLCRMAGKMRYGG